jgi:hypothetical protein
MKSIGEKMRKFIISLALIVSGTLFAADVGDLNLSVNRKGEDLIITATGKGHAPDLSQAVDNVLQKKIGTYRYRNDVYAPEHNFGPTPARLAIVDGEYKFVGGDGFNSSSKYPNFFNSPLIKNTDWSSEVWISEIRNECLNVSKR